MESLLKSVHIKNLWGKYEVNWENIDPQVNILVGINGCGKTTILNLIEEKLTGKYALKEKTEAIIDLDFSKRLLIQRNAIAKISTFDIPVIGQRGKSFTLDGKLEQLIFKRYTEKSYTFVDMQLDRLDDLMSRFYTIINRFFASSGKEIYWDKEDKTLRFHKKDLDYSLTIKDLSAGEKQLLIIFLEILLTKNEPFIILLDEPELSLDTEWQDMLIDALIELKPNAQFIISTHAPNIFGNGWHDKLVWIEDLYLNNAVKNVG